MWPLKRRARAHVAPIPPAHPGRAEPSAAARPAPMRDPAPSRVAYRMHRLWLTPLFRLLTRFGAPLVLSLALGLVWLGDGSRSQALTSSLGELRRSVAQRPEFMVKLMAIDGASPAVERLIRDTFPISFPVSSFDLDLEVMQAEIADFDEVESAALRIRPGGVLEVKLSERRPAVIWRSQSGLMLLDASGHPVMPLAHRTMRPDLPVLAGRGAEGAVDEALKLLAAAGPLARRLRGLVYVGKRRWDVVLANAPRLMLPESDPVTALEQIIALDQAQDLLARDITHVDMRNPLRPTLRMAGQAALAMHRIKATELGETLQ